MNLFELATRGVDLDALPDEPAPRERIAFEPSANTGKFSVPSDLNAAFDAAASDFGIDPDVLRAVAFAESRFRPDIINGEKRSSAGAIGLMQFMPETADEYGINPTDPIESIFGAAAYLRKSLDKFGGDYGKAVASYNAGPNRKAFDAADWDQRMPAETRNYLATVFDAAGQLKQSQPVAQPETQATQLPAGVTPSVAGAGRGAVSPGMTNTKLVRSAVPEMTAESVGRDVASGVLQIGPTAVHGVGDLLSLATGNRVGSGLREFAKSGKQAIQEVVGSERAQAQAQNLAADMADDSVGLADLVANNKGALADQILPTLGSMAIPLGAAGAAGKLATAGKAAQGLDKAAIAARVASAQQAAGIGATAAQNAASTFAELLDKGVPMQDAYVGAGITVPFSLIAGKLTGGGAEGALIRGIGPTGAARGVAEAVLKAPAREGLQEGGEALGQVLGEAGATSTLPTLNSALKQVGTEALLGAVVGGGMSGAQQLATPRVEAQPTTPTVPQVAPLSQAVTPPDSDAAKTQAVDNIAALLKQTEAELDGTTDTASAAVKPEQQTASFAQRTATPKPLPGVVPSTTPADVGVRTLVEDIKKKRAQDAEETAQIQQMLAEDDAMAEALASASMDETSRGQAAQIALQARARLVDDLVSSYAEPSEFFASRVLPAVDKQLAVLGRPPLAKDERARVDALLGSTRAFIAPKLPSAPAAKVEDGVLPDTMADNSGLESLIKERKPKQTGLAAEMAALKARSQPQATQQSAPVVKQDLTPAQTAPVTGALAAEMAAIKSRSQATTTVDPAKPVPVGIGRDNTPLADGGKPFKTKAEADTARKLQPMMRVKKQGKGFVLVEKTAAQIAAQEKAARRNLGSVGAGGGPLSAHAFLASRGGLSKSAMADLGFDRNVRVGSKWLFTNTGMTLEGMTEALQQNGYVQGTEQNPAIETVRRSANGQPQYTAEGWDQIAQAEATARFEDHLAAQQDAMAEDEDFDPFSPDAIAGDFDGDDLAVSGYDAKKDPIKLEVNALLAKAEALGIDTDTIRETAYEDTKNESEQAYYERVRDELTRAINASAGSGSNQEADGNAQGGQGPDAQRGGRADGRESNGVEGAPGADGPAEGLTDDGIKIYPGKGLIKGKYLAEVDGVGLPGKPFDSETEAYDAALKYREVLVQRANEVAEAQRRKEAIADKFRNGAPVTPAEIESLGLKASTSDMRWFMSRAADLFGLNARQIRPLVKDLIKIRRSDMGTEYEYVPTRKALEAIADRQNDALTSYTPEEVAARQDAATEAEATAKRAEEAAARAEAAAKQASEIAQRSVAAADTFELGGNAEDNLSGQQGLKFSRKASGVSVGFKPGTKFLQATSDAGMVGGTVKDGVLRITFSEVDESQRGQGNGLKLYQALIEQALDDGLKVTSDSTVEAEAVRVYEALGRRGYTVTRLDGGTTEDGAAYGVGATQPAFEVSRSDVAASLGSLRSQLDALGVAHSISESNGVITVSKIVVPQGQRNTGIGTQAMQAIVDHADATGQHIALTPSADFGGSKARLTGFYKRFGFKENKGRNRVFSVSESMVRENPNGKTLFSQSKQSPRTPVSTIRAAITKAYGNLLTRLESNGLVSLTQTEEEAIAAAAQARADKNGGDVEAIKQAMRASVRASSAMRLWVGSRTVNDALVPETEDYAGSKTGDLAYVPESKNVKGGPVRVAVGVAHDAHKGFGLMHLADNAARDSRRAPSSITGDRAEDLMRQAVAVLGNVSAVHKDGNRIVLVSSRTQQAVVAEWVGDHYSVVTVRPYSGSAVSLWGNPEWSGRLAFPLRADAGTAPSKASHQTIKPQSERDGQEVVSEKFNLTSEAKPNQPTVTVKKRRSIDIKRSADGNLEGFFDPVTGKSYLIADNLTAESAPGTLMHEVGIHMAADGKLEPVLDRAGNLLKMARDNEFIQRVQSRMDEAGETSNEEAAAYIVTEYEKDRTNAPASVGKWIKDFIADVRAWMFGKGVLLKADQLTVADIAAVARANANRMAKGESTDQTQTAAFKRWYSGRDAKVSARNDAGGADGQSAAASMGRERSGPVDAQGRPVVFFHGTRDDISQFDVGHPNRKDTGWLGRGIYGTSDPDIASRYASAKRGDGNQNVMPLYFAVVNPYPATLEMKRKLSKAPQPYIDEFTEKVNSLGHDGVTLTHDDGSVEVVAFEPTQVKSATGNNGDFDPANPDIRRSARNNAPKQAAATPAPVQQAKQSAWNWKDQTNRVQFAPGAWLYEKFADKAGILLELAGMKSASPELKKQLRAMKLAVDKAQKTSALIAKETAKLTQDERNMVSDIVEKTLKAGVVPPAHAIKLAALINQSMEEQTNELVSLGMLSQESADRWRGQYLPRYYDSKMGKKDPWATALMNLTKRAKLMRGIKGKHLKGRGMFETVPTDSIAEWEAMGWEVRDEKFDPAKDDTVQMWRDFTEEERADMGEIKDAGFRFVMGYMATQKDVAMGRMFKAISDNAEMSSRTQTDKHPVRVPDTKVDGTGANVYGALAGSYVSKEVLDHLSSAEEAQSDALMAYRKAMSLWKEGKTVLNPVSHVNNTVSNLTMAHLAGVGYHRIDKYASAVRDFAKNAPMLQEAEREGLFLGGFNQAELFDAMPDDLKALAKTQDGKGAKIADGLMQALSFGLRNPMGKAYEFEDSFFKYLIYRDARTRGMAAQDAVDYAQRYIFTYDDLPKTARKIRDFGIPFFAYTYKAVPALLESAMTHPHRIGLPAAMLYAATTLTYALAAGGDDEPLDELLKRYATDASFRDKVAEAKKFDQQHLPKWMQGYTSFATPKAIRVGHDANLDLPVFMDISRLIPGGDLFDVTPNAGGLPLPQPLTPSHPILTMLVGMIGNKDLFLGKDLVDKNDTTGEAAEKRTAWLYRQLAPAIAVGSYHWDRGLEMAAYLSDGEIKWLPDVVSERYTGIDRSGLPVQPKYAIPQTFGIKVRPIDQDKADEILESQDKKLIRDINAEISQIDRLNKSGSISDKLANKLVEYQQIKIDRIKDGMTVDGNTRD